VVAIKINNTDGFAYKHCNLLKNTPMSKEKREMNGRIFNSCDISFENTPTLHRA